MKSETSELPTPLSMTWKVSIEPLTFSSAYPVQGHQELELKRIQADFRASMEISHCQNDAFCGPLDQIREHIKFQ